MTALGTFKSQIYVMVEGMPLSPFIAGQLVSAEIESSMFLPDQFRLVFRGSRSDVLEQGRFQIASEVEISMLAGDERLPLVTGEVTALEVDFGRDGNLTVITGLDRCHRMMMGTKGTSWVGMTASDIVLEIIDDYGVIPGEIEPTATVYPVLEQPNISDWAFIQQLAFLENRDAYISQGFFTFKTPALASEGDTIPAMNYETPVLAKQLVLGKNLLHLHAVVTGSEQVPTVTVMGWDPTLAVPVMGVNVVTPVSSAPEDPGAEPEIVSGELGSKEFIFSDWPCDSEGQAETRAQSIAAQLAGGFAEMEGECEGDPNVVAGAVVSLGMAGQPFDGKYVVTSARHRFTPGAGGYTTWFNVGGRRDRGLASLGGARDPRLERQPISGVAIGVVEQVDDPEEMCRVKVRYPWLGEMIVSDWVRTVQPGAGPGYGFVVIPEPETEVLLAFDHGDINHPYIIGNLYNGIARPIPAPTMDPAGGIGERRIESRLHHMLQFNDGPEEQGINLVTGEDECAMTLSVEGSGGTNTITINSLGEVVIKAKGAVQIQSMGDMSLTSTGMLSLSADGEVSISSQAALTMKANAEMAIQSSAVVTVSGTEIMLGG